MIMVKKPKCFKFTFLIFLKTVSSSLHCSGNVLPCQSEVENPNDWHDCDEGIGEDKAEDNVREGTAKEYVDGAIKVATKVLLSRAKFLISQAEHFLQVICFISNSFTY